MCHKLKTVQLSTVHTVELWLCDAPRHVTRLPCRRVFEAPMLSVRRPEVYAAAAAAGTVHTVGRRTATGDPCQRPNCTHQQQPVERARCSAHGREPHHAEESRAHAVS